MYIYLSVYIFNDNKIFKKYVYNAYAFIIIFNDKK